MSETKGTIAHHPKNKREARAWVRSHWQTFMRNADVPDLYEVMPEESDKLIAEVFSEESRRLADRLEPRRAGRSALSE